MACSLTDTASGVTMGRIGAVRAACQKWYSGRESGSNLRGITGCGADHLALQEAIELTVPHERLLAAAFSTHGKRCATAKSATCVCGALGLAGGDRGSRVARRVWRAVV
ncbi:hypothetical protein BWQ96_08914 [Gracilariopsis chorda]|uniref:Uncharacterized protein n=1 Tax=Gracilariopsis chorda TaxID=448386 RepID=A0A2V3IGY4_9FLOR|nr:hypothetical protein BWQ96_08914 [Gracilariopsis chorda]|eukprot:PXF41366.1 hypothetical protein BWQ96_08914 [Gracilariopsis chorda]